MAVVDDVTKFKSRPACVKCGLWTTCTTPKLQGQGASNARIMLIGDAPGPLEDAQASPFVGPAGLVIDSMMEISRLPDDAVYKTYAVKCAPKGGKLTREKTRIKCCSDFLIEEIGSVDPDILVPLGAKATFALLGVGQMARMHARVVEQDGYLILPLYKPEAILRNPSLQGIYEAGWRLLQRVHEFGKPDPAPVDTGVCRTVEDVVAVVEEIFARGYTAYDYETNFLRPWDESDPRVGTVAFSLGTHRARCIPIDHPQHTWSEEDRAIVLEAVQMVLTDLSITRAAHNWKYEYTCTTQVLGFEPGPARDTMLEHVHVDEDSPHDLDTLSWRYTDLGGYDSEFKLTLKDKDFLGGDLDELGHYNCCDVLVTERLDQVEFPKLLTPQQNVILRDLQEPLIPVLSRVEVAGKEIDSDALLMLQEVYQAEGDRLEAEMRHWPEVCVAEAVLSATRVEKQIVKCRDEIRDLQMEVKSLEPGAALSRKEKSIAYRLDKIDKFGSPGASRDASLARYHQPFNFGSTDQVRVLLMDPSAFGWEPTKHRTDSGEISCGKEALIEWGRHHAQAIPYRRYKRIRHCYAQFLKPVPGLLGKQTGRIHASYNQHIARTGRLTSTHPNEQNRPRNDTCKSLGVPPIQSSMYCSRFDGGVILKPDYSQLELKLMACASGDSAMVEAYRNDWDLHARTTLGMFPTLPNVGSEKFAGFNATELRKFNAALEGLDDFNTKVLFASLGPMWKPKRTIGKRCNFLTGYGGGGPTLQSVLAETGMFLTVEECDDYIDDWFDIYPGVKIYMQDVRETAKDNGGIVVAPDGRMRHLPMLVHGDRGEMAHAEREAGNFAIQWLAAKLTMVAMLRIDEEMRERRMRSMVVGNIHDAILTDTHPDEIEDTSEILVRQMEAAAFDRRWIADPTWLRKEITITADLD